VVDSSPTVADGTVYVGSHDKTLYAVDAATGTEEWAFTQPTGTVRSSPTVADGTVYVGFYDGTLYAVDAATGEQEWAFAQPSDWVDSSPTVADGTVYVGSHDKTLYAVDAATGTQDWAFTQPSNKVKSSPTVADGTVYVGSRDETLYAVDVATGTQEWTFTQPSDWVDSSPTVADGTVYVGSYDSNLYAVDAATGTQEWAFTQPSNKVKSSPTVVADPESGDSVGSRVLLGTLGHHDGLRAGDARPHQPSPEVTCVRCGVTFLDGGYQFEQRIYCEECVAAFERVAEQGVVVRSRHGKPNFHEKPYVVTDGRRQYVEHSQTEALARGRELTEQLDTPGLFIYWETGSHWLLGRYLAEHPDIRRDVIREQRKIRGQRPIGAEQGEQSGTEKHVEIRPEGDAIVDSTVIDDSVVNRSSVDNQDEM
jgi:hypothetical protein